MLAIWCGASPSDLRMLGSVSSHRVPYRNAVQNVQGLRLTGTLRGRKCSIVFFSTDSARCVFIPLSSSHTDAKFCHCSISDLANFEYNSLLASYHGFHLFSKTRFFCIFVKHKNASCIGMISFQKFSRYTWNDGMLSMVFRCAILSRSLSV